MNNKTDIFSLGTVLYIMLSGYYPLSTAGVEDYILKMRRRKKLNFNHSNMWNIS